MLIRPALLSDVPAIMQLIKEVVPTMIASGNFQWDSAYPNVPVFERDIELAQLWVADDDGAIAGVSAITTDQEHEYASIGWDISEPAIVVHRLAVNINHRGKGVAAKLMQQAELEAVKKNIKVLRVDTNSNNQATQQLFPKLGYRFSGEFGLSFRPNLLFYGYEKRLDG